MLLVQKNPATRNRRNELILRPVHPNAGIESAYRKRLLALIDEMNRSFAYWIKAAWRSNEPVLAGDETPAITLRDALRDLSQRWRKRFDTASKELADYFARASTERSDAALRAILKKGGFSVEFKLTPAARDILQATIAENVALIKSIPEQYLTNVEGLVMRSVQAGRDLDQLTTDLQEQHGVTRRRAVLIARDQNNKATAAITAARQQELGVTEAIWVHSGGGKHPRPTHLKAGRERTRYDVKTGWYDPAVKKYIRPGELINCRCVSRSVVKGFGE
jgi:uncharacterized protein with gpF-like domain